jgi:Holliday junction resolvase RusA-like endonuclease
MTHSIFLPAGRYLNSNERLHHMAKAPITKAWRTTARDAAKGVPTLTRAHIVVTFSFANNIRRDVGNLYPTAKAIVDGLVDAGVLPDDDDKHVLGPDLRRGYDEPGVRIDITELAA